MKASPEILIRQATAHDIDAVVALDRVLERLPHWAASEYRVAIAGTSTGPLRCVFVATIKGEIMGLAVGMVQTIAEECGAELETVGVAGEMQRQGLGRELCRTVIGWCRAEGAAYVDLEVRSQSAGPIALYRELGFEITGRRPGYYRDPADDALRMRLDLGTRA